MVTLDVKYPAGHTYSEDWEKSEIYCPLCGKQGVWIEQGAGDYYVGVRHLCAACTCEFYMPNCNVMHSSDTLGPQRLAAFRAAQQ